MMAQEKQLNHWANMFVFHSTLSHNSKSFVVSKFGTEGLPDTGKH